MPRVGTKELADHVEWTALKRTRPNRRNHGCTTSRSTFVTMFSRSEGGEGSKEGCRGAPVPYVVAGSAAKLMVQAFTVLLIFEGYLRPSEALALGARSPAPPMEKFLPTSAQSNANLWHTCSVQSVVTD